MKKILSPLIVPMFLLLAWWISTQLQLISPLFLPELDQLSYGFVKALKTTLVKDIFATILRTATGLAIATFLGVPIGLILGNSKKLYHSFEFTIDFFRSIPITAIFPLFLLIFGIGNESKIAMISCGAIAFIIINTMHGVHNLRITRLSAGRIIGLKGLGLFREVILPEALPSIITGFRLALSYALIIAIVTEMLFGSDDGLGYRIINAQYIYDTAGMYVGIISAGFIGFTLNKLAAIFEHKFIHWKGR